MQPLLITGLHGLVGSRLAMLYQDRYSFDSLDVSDPQKPVNITDAAAVDTAVGSSAATHLIHLAAYTDVSKAWEERDNREGLTYRVNVLGTQNVIAACKNHHKHLIHLSTAFVFDGQKPGLYTEQDTPNPIEWYGQTKWEAEQKIMESGIDWTILRIDFPFRPDSFVKPDIVRKIIDLLKQGKPLFTDHYFGPTYIDDLAKIIEWVIASNTTGLFHASSGEQWSDFALAQAIIKQHNLPVAAHRSNLIEYLKQTVRPYQKNTALEVTKLQALLPFTITTIGNAISRIVL